LASKQQRTTSAPQGRLTKAERKEQARLERIELQRRMARARRNRTLAIAGIVLVGVAIIAGLALTSENKAKTSASAPLPGLMTGPAPWSANLDTLPDRLARLKLPPFGNPLALHHHAHLDLFVNGSRVTVPADIGFSTNAAAALHTHDQSGVVHMESSQANARFTLGEFFDVWGLRLSSTCVGGYCDQGARTIRTFVDGKPYAGNPRAIELHDQQEIVLTYGTENQVPKPLPTFDWSTLAP
jgi:hypothetical protein